jgi:hypothetical protein
MSITMLAAEPLQDLGDPALGERYRQQGLLALAPVLAPAEVEQAKRAIRELVVLLASSPTTVHTRVGTMTGNHAGLVLRDPNSRCAVQLEPDAQVDVATLAPEQIELRARKVVGFEARSPVLARLARAHPVITAVLDQILGEGWRLHSCTGLLKPPGGVAKPWHQDCAFHPVSDLDGLCTVWIALDEATPDNGCLRLIRSGHRAGPLTHVHGLDWTIAPERLDQREAVVVPLQPGGVVFIHGLLPHMTPVNHSARRRRALQLLVLAHDVTLVSANEYRERFVADDGSAATCPAAGG